MSEPQKEQPPDVPDESSRTPVPWPRIPWILLYPVAGAYGGWQGVEFLTWLNFFFAICVGIAVDSIAVAISWLRFPARNEDGSLHFRSLYAVVVTMGIVGGTFFGLIIWLLALVASNLAAKLPNDWNGEFVRTCVGGILGVVVALSAVWQMKRQRN